VTATPEETTQTPTPPPAVPARRPVYRRRFLLVYAVLIGCLGAGAAAFVFLFNKPNPPPPPAWSAWQPSASGLERARQVASFVASRYRLPSGDRLVDVRAGPPIIRDTPLSAIAIRPSSSSSDIKAAYPTDSAILYILCGDIDLNCAIAEGKASAARGRVLRREGLELALYTFTYMKEIDSVFEFMPPPRGKKPTSALFFRREDLARELDKPLRDTLPAAPPYVSTGVSPAEAPTVDLLTGTHQFTYVFGQLKDGSTAALLTPLGS
jgi:hypothetical protein